MSNGNGKTKEEIFKSPISKVATEIKNPEVLRAIETLYKELDKVGIKHHPQVYLSDSWGCPDGVPVIGIPFYLASEELAEIEKEKIGRIESFEEIMQIIRHESGHAFNYAHSLHKFSRWNDTFGAFEKPYEENFAPVVGSNKFVRHLEGWYAQKHPDEDFAETFAVLITPGIDWRKLYKEGTKARKKLIYCSELIKEYGHKEIRPISQDELDVPVQSMSMTLGDWYDKKMALPKPGIKISILFYQEYPKRIPVHDQVVDQIKEVLLDLNYSVSLLPVNQSIERIITTIKNEKPDLVFNLCETFRNNDTFEFNMAALLEMIKVPFTGSSSGSLYLSHDKYLSKKIFDFHRIPYPDFFFIPKRHEVVIPKSMTFPLFVKPAHEDASIGIDDNSVVRNEEELQRKVKEIHEFINDDALVEEFIDGREFYISILGNDILRTLEIVELDFSKWPSGKPKIYSHKAKIDEQSDEFKSIDFSISPLDLTIEQKKQIYEAALKVYRALDVRDYARIDMRMTPDNKIYVLEANLNPYLSKDDLISMAAESSGLNYKQLIDKVLEAALKRTGLKK